MKYILILVFLLVSCGTVKKTNEEKETKIDTQLDLTRWSNSISLEPVDLEKPILINLNGKTDTIYNTKVIYNNSKEIVKENTNVEQKEEKKEKERDYTEVINILGNKLLILIGILFVIYMILNFFKK